MRARRRGAGCGRCRTDAGDRRGPAGL